MAASCRADIQVSKLLWHRLYALSRMVDVVLYNQARVHDVWPMLLDHVVELLSDSRPPVRAAAVDALGRALTGALASCAPPKPHEVCAAILWVTLHVWKCGLLKSSRAM